MTLDEVESEVREKRLRRDRDDRKDVKKTRHTAPDLQRGAAGGPPNKVSPTAGRRVKFLAELAPGLGLSPD